MKKHKKWFVFLLVAMMVASITLAGCGNNNDATDPGDDNGDPVGFEDKEWVIGLSQESLDHPFMVTQRKQIMDEADKYPNVRVIATDGQGSVVTQAAGIDDMIAQGIDILLVQAAQAEGLKQKLDEVHAQGIPYLFVGKPIHGTDAVTMVSMNNLEIGKQIGQFIVDHLQEKYGEVKGNLVLIEGIPGDETSVDRIGGAREILDKYPDINIVAQQPADYRRPQAVAVMQNVLQANAPGTIDVVYAANGEMALGAIQAVKDADRMVEMIIIGLDGQKEELDAIEAGDLAATWQYKPAGNEGFEYAIKILKGEPVDPVIIIESAMITKDNVSQFEPSF